MGFSSAGRHAGKTAETLRCAQGDVDHLRALLAGGEEASTADGAYWTPLHEAAAHGSLAAVRLLLDQGADVKARTDLSYTPLHFAASGDRVEVAELLLAHGAEVNALTAKGETPLDLARRFTPKPDGERMSELLERHGGETKRQPRRPRGEAGGAT